MIINMSGGAGGANVELISALNSSNVLVPAMFLLDEYKQSPKDKDGNNMTSMPSSVPSYFWSRFAGFAKKIITPAEYTVIEPSGYVSYTGIEEWDCEPQHFNRTNEVFQWPSLKVLNIQGTGVQDIVFGRKNESTGIGWPTGCVDMVVNTNAPTIYLDSPTYNGAYTNLYTASRKIDLNATEATQILVKHYGGHNYSIGAIQGTFYFPKVEYIKSADTGTEFTGYNLASGSQIWRLPKLKAFGESGKYMWDMWAYQNSGAARTHVYLGNYLNTETIYGRLSTSPAIFHTSADTTTSTYLYLQSEGFTPGSTRWVLDYQTTYPEDFE